MIDPFRRDIRTRDRGGDDWCRFGYRVIRNSLFSQQQQGRIDAAGRLQLAGRVLTMAIDGRWPDTELPGDLFGVHVRVNEAQAFALAVGQSINTVRHPVAPGCPGTITTRRLIRLRTLRRPDRLSAGLPW